MSSLEQSRTLLTSLRNSPNLLWYKNPPSDLEKRSTLLARLVDFVHDDSDHAEHIRDLYRSLQQEAKDIADEAKRENPLAFMTLSWEQTLKCNSWVWGITFLCDFDANRKGKTTGAIISALLWLYPNDPLWDIFKPYTDEWGRYTSLLQKPTMVSVHKIQEYLVDHPELKGDPKFQPYDSENLEKFNALQLALPDAFKPAFPFPSFRDPRGIIWQGGPDADYHKQIIMPEWNKWLPRSSVEAFSEHEKRLKLSIKYLDKLTNSEKECRWTIIFKSYESKDEKFSGAAVKGILLTEGLKAAHLNEIKQRFQTDGFASWDYTPYEARNAGAKTALAHKVFTGKEQLPLHPFVFTGFGIEKTPDYILPNSKKLDLQRMWKGKPEGEARLNGNFFTSSPVVLSNLDLQFHGVPWSLQELFDRFPEGRLYRGLDPGWDHPTAMVWGLLTKTNIWYIYRIHAEANLGIAERCEKIIKFSGNSRIQVKYGPGEDDYYYEEVHDNPDSEVIVTTIADYHTFKTDERTKRPYSANYIKEGLVITPSTTLSPKHRGTELNDRLRPDLLKGHPIYHKPPGAKIYFLVNEYGVAEACEKLENIFWERYAQGERKGEPKDEIQSHDDDEFDAICYLVCSPYRWTIDKPSKKTSPENKKPTASPIAVRDISKRVRRRILHSSTGY